MTPSHAGNGSQVSLSPAPLGLPLSRSPNPLRRLQPAALSAATRPAWQLAMHGDSETPSPHSVATPTSLHMSVHNSSCIHQPSRTHASSSLPDTSPGTLTDTGSEDATNSGGLSLSARLTGCVASEGVSSALGAALSSPNATPASTCSIVERDISGAVQVHVAAPWLAGAHAVPLNPQNPHAVCVPCSVAGASSDDGGALPRFEYAPRSGLEEPTMVSVADVGQRRLGAADGDSGSVHMCVAPATSIGPGAGPAKDGADAAVDSAATCRSMIGSKRPHTAASTSAGNGSCATEPPALLRPLSPVLPPVTLNRIRLTHAGKADAPSASAGSTAHDAPEAGVPATQVWHRASDGAAAAEQEDAAGSARLDGGAERDDDSIDLWAGASPFLLSRDGRAGGVAHAFAAGAYEVAVDSEAAAAAAAGAPLPKLPSTSAQAAAGAPSQSSSAPLLLCCAWLRVLEWLPARMGIVRMLHFARIRAPAASLQHRPRNVRGICHAQCGTTLLRVQAQGASQCGTRFCATTTSSSSPRLSSSRTRKAPPCGCSDSRTASSMSWVACCASPCRGSHVATLPFRQRRASQTASCLPSGTSLTAVFSSQRCLHMKALAVAPRRMCPPISRAVPGFRVPPRAGLLWDSGPVFHVKAAGV